MTDPDAAALLRAIVRHPDEDTPRLVYADWLEENGRGEEAEFLRVQCALASTEPDDPEYPPLLDRSEELRLWLTAHVPGPRPTFPGGLGVDGGSHWWKWTHRGFPRFLEFDGYQRPGVKAMRALASALKRAFEALPTRWLVVGSITVDQLAALVKQSVLAGLTELTVQLAVDPDEANEAARLLAGCRHLRNLRGLALAFGFGDAGCEALAGAPWGGLEWFSPDCNELTAAGLRGLAAAPWVRNLGELTLDHGLPDEAFEALVQLPPFRRLHTLDLSKNRFSPEAWEAFARTRTFPALARLRCEENDLSNGRMGVLAAADGFTLRMLTLPGSGAEPGDAITRAPWVGSLRVLDLDSNALTPQQAKAVAGCRKLTALRRLNLANNALGPTTLAALTSNPSLRGLRALDLSATLRRYPELTPAHFNRFLSALAMPELRHLNLSGRPIGARAARNLTDPKFAPLTRLGLSRCQLTDAAVKSLLASPTLQNLIQLALSDNRLTTGPESLTDRSVLPRLAACSLDNNALPQSLTRKLRRRPGIWI